MPTTPSTSSAANRAHNTRAAGQPLLPPLGVNQSPRSLGFGRGRSPSPRAEIPQVFVYPAPADQGVEQSNFEDAMEPDSELTIDALLRRAEAAEAAAASATQALRAAGNLSNNNKRRPELPNFDPKEVEIWIRRVESAYIRAGISSATDKFAFVESKFDVSSDPRINQFLYGEATDAAWAEFLKFLRSEYGVTREQRTKTAIDGIRRDGRRPTKLMALLKEQTKDVTLDDILKEQLLRELPNDIKKIMGNKVQSMTADEVAKQADSFFDRDGRQLHMAPNSINLVHQEPMAEHSEDDEEPAQVNAVGHRPRGNQRPFQRGPQHQPRQQPRQQSSQRPKSLSRTGPTANFNKGLNQEGICWYHSEHGDKAQKCYVGCKFASGNGQRGARK